jgi:hypothetical protein
VSAVADRFHKWIFQIKKNPSPDLGPSDPDPGLGVVAIAVEPGWKTIHDVLFDVVAHPRVGSQGQVVMKVPQGDAGAARRGLAWPGSPYLPAARCRAEGTTRKRTCSALRVVPCRGEALEPAHEERGNSEWATVGGADGGGKKTEEALTGSRYGEFGLRLGASCAGRFELWLGKKVAWHERAGTALRLAVGVVLVLVTVDDEDAIGDTNAVVEDPVLALLPSMVRGT